MTYPLQFVRPDLVMRTSVLEPTAEGYQPVEAAQDVATQFTRIYGPTVWKWKQKKGSEVMGHLGQTAPPRGYAAGWHPRQRMAAGLYTDPAFTPRGLYQRPGRRVGQMPRPVTHPGMCPPCPVPPKAGVMVAPGARPGTAIFTRKGPMKVTGAVGADTNEEAIAAIARAFARGQSVRIRDHRGRIAVAHPGSKKEKHTFFESVINRAREFAAKVFKRRPKLRKKMPPRIMTAPPPGTRVVRDHRGKAQVIVRDHRMAPTVPARPGQIVPAKHAVARPPVSVVRAYPSPRFNRVAQAAGGILKKTPSALPNRSLWLPPYQGAKKEVPREANAAAVLAAKLTRGPQSVTRPAVANAMNAFRNTGRYF